MLPHQIRELSSLEPWHFWFVARRRLLRELLSTHLGQSTGVVLELGCGSGALLRELADEGAQVVGIDRCPEGLTAQQRSTLGGRLLRGDAQHLPLRDGTVDAALLLDLLEHVDDTGTLSEVRRVLRPGGVVVLTAPAFPQLWSIRDELASHQRRYTRASLQTLVANTGFELLELRFFQSLLFPLFVLARVLGRRSAEMRAMENAPPRWLNATLLAILEAERGLHPRLRLPFGSSMIAICRARQEDRRP